MLFHGLHGQEVLRRLPRNADPEALPDDPAVFGPNTRTGVATHYVDALDNQEYLAAYAAMKNRDWRVIVQYDREKTLAPSRDLAEWMRNVGVVALIGAVLFILGLFALLVKTLRRGENTSHA